jgi:virginiamycin B lyase
MTFFPTAPAGTTHVVSPERITAGPDGNLYFVAAEPQNAPALALGKITTAGVISYSVPFGTSANFQDSVAVGPDNNLWMTDLFDNKVFRITTGGVATGFLVGKYLGIQEDAYGIAAGPNETLWFTTNDDNELGRISFTGRISFHATPTCNPSNCGTGGGIVRLHNAMWNTLPGNKQTQDILESINLP